MALVLNVITDNAALATLSFPQLPAFHPAVGGLQCDLEIERNDSLTSCIGAAIVDIGDCVQ